QSRNLPSEMLSRSPHKMKTGRRQQTIARVDKPDVTNGIIAIAADAADADAMIDPARATIGAGSTVTVIVPRNPRSQTFSKRDRRSWFRWLKNLSPKTAPASHRTSHCLADFWFTCRLLSISAFHAK